MTSILFDTNVFLRFLLNDIPYQAEKAADLVEKAKLRQIHILVPQIVIFEIYFSLEKFYKLRKDEIVEKLVSMLAAQYFTIQNRDVFKQAIRLFAKTNLDFVDCFLLCRVEQSDAELFTFDKKLLQAARNFRA